MSPHLPRLDRATTNHKIHALTHPDKTVVVAYVPVLSSLPTRITRVTIGQVLLCRKKHLGTYIQPGKALSLEIEDIGRRRLLTQPRHAGSCR
jgi:hypothetical protein